MITGCIHKNASDQKNVDDVSIYDNAFTITLPHDVKKSKDPLKNLGEEVQYWSIFTNNDSTIKVDIEIRRNTSRSFAGLVSDQIDLLRHFEPSMVILNKELLNYHGSEKLLIMYEIPPVRGLPGYIVERNIFFTHKGRATANVMCRFDDPKERGNCIKLVKTISESIKVS